MLVQQIQQILTQSDSIKDLFEASKMLDHHTLIKANSLENSSFIKSWQNVSGYALYLFYNHSAQTFWAIIQGCKGVHLIPDSDNGFELIKIPLLECKIMRNKLKKLEYPFNAPSSLVQFFRKELRYPIIKESGDGYIIHLKSCGLLGGGAKVSHVTYVAQTDDQEKVKEKEKAKEQVIKFLLDRYEINQTQESKDKQLAEKMADKICRSLPSDHASVIDKHLTDFIDTYEEEYFDEVILEVLGKPGGEGKLQLTEYTENFNSRKLCIEMLRKGYFAKERAMGGIEEIIAEKILAKLTEQTEQLVEELKQNKKGNLTQEDEKFGKLLLTLQKREEIQNLFESLTTREAKKPLKMIKDELQLQTEDQKELVNELCSSTLRDEVFMKIKTGLLTHNHSFQSSGTLKHMGSSKVKERRGSVTIDHESPTVGQLANAKLASEVSYLHKVRLNVLNELNLLDHELSSIVELHNLLKAEIEAGDVDAKRCGCASKSSKLEDIKSIIKSLIRGYRENESNLEATELASLLPLAFVQDPDIYRDFLEVFLEDLRNDILFDHKKAKMLSFILLGAMRNKDFKKYCETDHLIKCLKVLKPKIEDLSITAENINIQEAINALNDILYLLGSIGSDGVKGEYISMVTDLTKYMETHKLEKAFSIITRKSKDPSLHIKREYTIEALKRIKVTKYEVWEENFNKLLQVKDITMNIGKGIFFGDMSNINEALLQIKDLLIEAVINKEQGWYDHANELRFLAHESIDKIRKELFKPQSYSKQYTFFVIEFLLSVMVQPLRKLREKKGAAQILWFLANGYEHRVYNSRQYLVRSKKFKVDRDLRAYVRKSLLALSEKVDIDFNIFIRKLLDPPLTIDVMDNNQINPFALKQERKSNQEENLGKRFYIRILMEKKPKLYALARIQKHSERTLDKPSILIDFRGIDKEKDFDEGFMRRLQELVENMKTTDLEKPMKEIDSLQGRTTTRKILMDVVEMIAARKGEFNKNKEAEVKKKMQETVKDKVKEITEENTFGLLQVLEDFLNNPSKTVLLIQGDAGAGKTLLLRLFEQSLWKRYNTLYKADSKSYNRLPLRIPLSEVRSFDKAVEEFLLQNGCNLEAIHDIKREPVVILFDGYDEINQYINLYNLNKLETWKDVKVIFTSRKENLTSLKEEYVACFAPGDDRQKVLSYIIQPINEDQIRNYFNAQVKENENKIKKLEEKLRAMKGTRSSVVSISKTIQKEVDYLNTFEQSERFGMVSEILKVLEEQVPELAAIKTKVLQLKNEDTGIASLQQIFQKKIDKLKHITDLPYLQLIASKIEANLDTIKAVEEDIETMNNETANYETDIDRIKIKMKRFNKITSLKKISQLLERILQDVEDLKSNLPDSFDAEEQDLEVVRYRIEKVEKDANPESFGNYYKQLSENIIKIKDFDKKLREAHPEDVKEGIALIGTENAEAYAIEIKHFNKFDKLKASFEKLKRGLKEYQDLKTQLNSLIKREKETNQFQPVQGQEESKKSARAEKWKIIAQVKECIGKMQQVSTEEFGVFDKDFFDNPFVIDNDTVRKLYESANEETRADFNEIETAFDQLQNIEEFFSVFKERNGGLESVSGRLHSIFNKIVSSIYIENIHSPLKRLKQMIDEVTQHMKELTGLKSPSNEGSEIAEAIEKQIADLRSTGQYKFRDVIQKLEKISGEVKAVENESKAAKDDANDESMNMKALYKEIKDLEKFSDTENLESIIKKFKDIINSPFMLRMLLQTLLKFPKSSANRSELYRLFSSIHFEREKEKLLRVEKVPPKFNIIDSFCQYSKDLAVNMFIRKVTSLQAKSSGYKVLGIVEEQKKNIWNRFFDDQDILTRLSRRGAQIIEDDGVIRFVHKSILEYFAARQFFDEIVDYNPDNQDEYEPCLNKGAIIDNETAVYMFLKDITETQGSKDSEGLTIFDKKLLEILNSTVLYKKYGCDFNDNYFYPNLFLLLLLRGNLVNRITRQKEDSITFVVIANVFKWIFNGSEPSGKYTEMLEKVYEADFKSYKTLNYLLPFYYHPATKQESDVEFKDRFVTAKREQQIKANITSNTNPENVKTSFEIKDGFLHETPDVYNYSWILDGKLFIHDSMDSIVVLTDQATGKHLAYDPNKEVSNEEDKKDSTKFVLNDSKTPWEVRDCKWILRMNHRERVNFTLISIADSSKILYGSFKNLDEYRIFFKDLCSCDIHTGSVNDHSYQCATCDINRGKILCQNCKDQCHKDHQIVDYGRSGGYCDCRFLGCCEIVKGCTARFPEGYNNIVMYKCMQCPAEKRNRILCLACKKHHEEDHQKFEIVKDAAGCECDCLASRTKIIAKAIFSLYNSRDYEDNDDDEDYKNRSKKNDEDDYEDENDDDDENYN